MHYFTRDDGRLASCETDERRAGLEARGFTLCTYATFRAAWAENDRLRRLALAQEDQAEHERRELARIVGKRPGVIYPVNVAN